LNPTTWKGIRSSTGGSIGMDRFSRMDKSRFLFHPLGHDDEDLEKDRILHEILYVIRELAFKATKAQIYGFGL